MIALWFILASYGLTFLIRSSSLVSRPRTWLRVRNRTLDTMLDCAFCTGFWCALFVGWSLFRPGCWAELVLLWLVALAGAAAVYILDVLVLFLETLTAFLERDE